MYVTSDQPTSVEDQHGAFGAIVVNDIAAALGPTGIPGPFTDGSDDGWLVHQGLAQQSANSVASQAIGYEIDSKAMRKIEPGFQLAYMIENFSAIHVMNVDLTIRVLAKITQ